MRVKLNKVGKRFNKEWILKNLSLDIPSQSSLSITGANGSGKSTLIKLISAYMEPTLGNIQYFENENIYPIESISQSIGLAAPYVDLIEEFSLKEHVEFHFKFRSTPFSLDEIIAKTNFQFFVDKKVKDFSSGMKQRLKLALAIYAENKLLILDEPTSNLDQEGIEWYRDEILQKLGTCTIIVASNQQHEYDFIPYTINLSNKQKIYVEPI
ncbi:MAG: ABC transporter ATP-binding protein [Flammeovirgaceae bacterium]|jgi:ABC-type multidrug transport system ATPase subunit|nr:ABC transporter ATP-binding protein [Flammeovirgaceae bacterium]